MSWETNNRDRTYAVAVYDRACDEIVTYFKAEIELHDDVTPQRAAVEVRRRIAEWWPDWLPRVDTNGDPRTFRVKRIADYIFDI